MTSCTRKLGWLLLLIFAPTICFANDQITAAEIVSRHLDSIGAPAVRNENTRVVEGTATYRIVVGGNGEVPGKAVIASEGEKREILLKINAFRYEGERFISTGKETDVAGTYAEKTRSEFGQFLRAEDLPLREGLLGGVLSTAWPLLDLQTHKATVIYEGLKKIDGLKLYALRYKPEKVTDMTIMLYFDPESFHHVVTVYTVSAHAGLGGIAFMPLPGATISNGASEIQSARQNQTRFRIEEHFKDFKTSEGLTLPTNDDLRFTAELQSGFTKSVEWRVETKRVLNNISVDARNFEIQ